MRRSLLLCVLAVVMAVGGAAPSPAAAAPAPDPAPAGPFDQTSILVRFVPGADTAAAARRHRTPPRRWVGRTGYQQLDLDGADPSAKLEELRRDPDVADVQLNTIRRIAEVPNDPLYGPRQQSYMSTMRLPEAWTVSKGSANITVAVIDTGVDLDTPDLAGRILPGYDFVKGDTDPSDDNGHGTAVSSAIAAITNNGLGIAGAAWEAKVLPLKALDAKGSGSDADIASAIDYATGHGASIINMSLSGATDNPVLASAVANAVGAGVVVVAAAGNESRSAPAYPAAYNGVIAVSSTDDSGSSPSSFSNFGPWVDVAAPGENIAMAGSAAGPAEAYVRGDGTSFSAPLVAAAAVLVKAQHTSWTATQVASAITANASDRGAPGFDPYFGAGLLDAYAAVTDASSWIASTNPADPAAPFPNGGVPSVTFTKALDPASVSASTVKLADLGTGGSFPGSVAYDAVARRITFTPARLLEYQHPYRLVIGNVVESGTGNVFAGRSVRFNSAAAPTYSTPTLRWYEREVNAAGAADSNFSFGGPGCTAVVGDWNGDGIDTPGLYCGGTWYLRNSNTPGSPDISFAFGTSGYVPVVGNWDGIGGDGIGVYVNGTWYLRNTLSPGGPEITPFAYGTTGYTPVVGNWDGIGGDGIGVYVNGSWYLRNATGAGAANLAFAYGTSGYKPVVGKFGGGSQDGVGIVTGPSWYLRTTPTPGAPQVAFAYGDQSYQTVTGDWDGDGTDTVAVVVTQ